MNTYTISNDLFSSASYVKAKQRAKILANRYGKDQTILCNGAHHETVKPANQQIAA